MLLIAICVAIAFGAGMIGGTPKNSSLMAAIAGATAGLMQFLIDEEFVYGSVNWEYLPATVLLPCIAAAVMAFAVSKLKR